MSGKSINFDDKKSTKAISTKIRNYLIYIKKNHIVKKIHLNTLFDIMMMLLDHYDESES